MYKARGNCLIGLLLLLTLLSGLVSAQGQPAPTREPLEVKYHRVQPSVLGLPAAPDAPTVAPTNDNFTSAQAVTLPSVTSVTTMEDATVEIGETTPTCGTLSLHSVWFTLTLAETKAVTLKTTGSNFDTVLAVYTGSTIDGLTEIACNDEFNSYVDSSSALFNVQIAAGTTYYIRVSEFQGDTQALQPLPANSSLSLQVKETLTPISVTVNNKLDTVDANPGDGLCADAGALCSLRAAVMEANELQPGSTITLPAGTYTFAADDSGEDGATTGDLDILGSMTINGAGAHETTIDAAQIDSVFHLRTGAALTLSGVTLKNGKRIGDGGGIRAVGPNTALTLNGVTISNSQAEFGGGIELVGAALTMHNSAVVNNIASADGGGIDTFNAATSSALSLTNVTVSTNSAANGAGVNVDANASLTVNNVTVAFNTASDQGGGVRLDGGTASVSNTIMASNTAPNGPDCFGTFTSTGDNLVTSLSGCTLAENDLVVANPRLDPLEFTYPSHTPTHPIRTNSKAFNGGTPATCALTDQRNILRPQDASCDIGAYERVMTLPGVFTLTAPANAALITDLNTLTAFSWTESTMAFSYTLVVTRLLPSPMTSVIDTELSPYNVCAAGTCSYAVDPGLAASLMDGQYQWTVSALNTGGTVTGTPATASFTIDTPAPNIVELLDNGSFETRSVASKNIPDRWNPVGRSADKRVCNTAEVTFTPYGTCAYKFKGKQTENSKLAQSAKLTGKTLTQNTVLTLSAQVKAKGAVKLRLKLRVTYANPQLPMGKLNIPVTASADYSTYSQQFELAGEPTKVKVLLHNLSKSGKIFVDEVSLSMIEP